jgi:hypothetical protein
MMVREGEARELLDGPLPPAALRATLDDLDFLNAWFGGYALTLSRIRRAAAALPRGRRLVVVDVGGGRGDFAITVVRWARRRCQPVRVLVIDADAATLAAHRRLSGDRARAGRRHRAAAARGRRRRGGGRVDAAPPGP